MTQFTEERFEQILDEKLAPVATKEDVHRVVRDGVEELARIVKASFDGVDRQFAEVRELLDVRNQMDEYERKFRKLEDVLHVKL